MVSRTPHRTPITVTPFMPKSFIIPPSNKMKDIKDRFFNLKRLGLGHRKRKWKVPSMEEMIPNFDVKIPNVKKMMKKINF